MPHPAGKGNLQWVVDFRRGAANLRREPGHKHKALNFVCNLGLDASAKKYRSPGMIWGASAPLDSIRASNTAPTSLFMRPMLSGGRRMSGLVSPSLACLWS